MTGSDDGGLTAERRRVELVEHSADWGRRANLEASRIAGALGDAVLRVHHVGSTAIPGIRAKPILDLLPELPSLEALDEVATRVCSLGYQWRGEFGIAGRRYCTLDDAATGARQVQLHCFATGHPEIERMLMFRDYLRAHREEARAYEAEKERCRRLHPDDTLAYAAAKTAWIKDCETRARAAAHTMPTL